MQKYVKYIFEYYRFRQSLNRHEKSKLEFRPSLTDHDAQAGSLDSHYFWQDLLIAALIFERKPSLHLDIGSRIDGFISSISLFTQVHVMDVRPLSYNIPNVKFIQNDLTKLSEIKKYHSISCLHTIEHIGLGRYGDTLNKSADLEAIKNIGLMAHTNASVYISTPVGRSRIKFNKHRIYNVGDFVGMFVENGFTIKSISILNDKLEKIDFGSDIISATNYGKTQVYSCGLFEFKKC